VRPMPRIRPNTRNPVHPPVAASAVEQQPAEFPLQLGLRLQELHP
jgi:hypothetical protein